MTDNTKNKITSLTQAPVQTQEDAYLKHCLAIPPSERLRLGFELSEWSKILNKRIHFLVEERLKDGFLLK